MEYMAKSKMSEGEYPCVASMTPEVEKLSEVETGLPAQFLCINPCSNRGIFDVVSRAGAEASDEI